MHHASFEQAYPYLTATGMSQTYMCVRVNKNAKYLSIDYQNASIGVFFFVCLLLFVFFFNMEVKQALIQLC